MPAPILNLADVVLEPRLPLFQPTGQAAERFDARFGAIGARIGAASSATTSPSYRRARAPSPATTTG